MWICLLTAALAAGPQFNVEAAGKTLTGSLAELSAEHITLATAAGPVAVPTAQAAQVSPQSPPAAPAERPTCWIELVDGSLLAARSYTAKEGEATVAIGAGASVQIPTRSVAVVRFKDHSGPIAEQWEEIVGTERTGDWIVVRKKEALDYASGVLGDVSDQAVQFTIDGDTLSVKRSRVDGLLYFHSAGRELPAAFCRLTDASGSRIEVETATVAGDQLRLKTPSGLELGVPLAQVAGVDFKVQYLSDLTPESVVWTPYFGQADKLDTLAAFYQPRMNQSLEGGELRLGGQIYAKGLSLHSRTEMVYRLPAGQFGSLRALAGLDDRARPAGHVRLAVYGDDRVLFEAVLTGQDEPRPVQVNLQGVRRLRVVVDFGDDLDVSDYLNLCDARLLK